MEGVKASAVSATTVIMAITVSGCLCSLAITAKFEYSGLHAECKSPKSQLAPDVIYATEAVSSLLPTHSFPRLFSPKRNCLCRFPSF